jgi:DNA replication protein DnaC
MASDTTRKLSPDDAPRCQNCLDAGWIRSESGLTKPCPECSEAEEGRRQARIKDVLLNRTGLTDTEQAETFFAFQVLLNPVRQEMIDKAHRFVEQSLGGWSLAFVGGVGNGKSHMLHAMTVALAEDGREARYVVVPDMMKELSLAIDAKGNSPAAVMVELANEAFLLLDELPAADAVTNWERGQIDYLINRRYRDRMPTAIASNHSLAELPERIRDRLEEGELVLTKELPSWRRR